VSKFNFILQNADIEYLLLIGPRGNASVYTFDIEFKEFLAVFVRSSGIIPILSVRSLFQNDREFNNLSTSTAYNFPSFFA
jgi:hypothetical protein